MKLNTLAIAGLLACTPKQQVIQGMDRGIFISNRQNVLEEGLFIAEKTRFVGERTEMFVIPEPNIRYVARFKDNEKTGMKSDTLCTEFENKKFCLSVLDKTTVAIDGKTFPVPNFDYLKAKYAPNFSPYLEVYPPQKRAGSDAYRTDVITVIMRDLIIRQLPPTEDYNYGKMGLGLSYHFWSGESIYGPVYFSGEKKERIEVTGR